jgi:D-serine deaminase-like pyridoxal phosphate-dependent protein
MDYNRIRKPALILDEQKCRQNIRRMEEKAKQASVQLRPHFKTHQSLTVGNWFSDENINVITVSSVTMAKHFGQSGWKDITIAFPLNPREIKDLEQLSDICQINIVSPGYEHLEALVREINFNTGCFIKINTGNNRSGLEWNDKDSIMRMVDLLVSSTNLRFTGFLIHAGHTYRTHLRKEIIDIHDDTLNKARYLREITGGHNIIISTGDTPSCSIVSDFPGIDEIRPGNFVFYDLTQAELGSCSRDDIAVALACPVVEKNYSRQELIIYGGGVHLSKESLILRDGRTVYGEIVEMHKTGWNFPGARSFVKGLSQEHGIISSDPELLRQVKIGDLIGIIPVHSCMTADLMREYYATDNTIINDLSPK